MTDQELKLFVQQVVRQTLAPILLGTVAQNDDSTYGSAKHIGQSSPIEMRTILPYGFFSRAPVGTPGLMIPLQGDPSHINMVGHADPNRPDCEDGTSGLYDAVSGNAIFLADGKLYFGSKASSEPMVLGNELKELLGQILDLLANQTFPSPGAPSSSAPQFTQLKSNFVENDAILSAKSFTEK